MMTRNNLRQSLGLWLTIPLGLSLNGCSFVSLSQNQAGAEKPQTDQVLISESQTPKGQNLPISARLMINEQQIDLEVAKTPEQQQLGLMYRSSLPDNQGMLFPFEQSLIASFWMKNVDIDLDMIFLADGVVDSIAHNVPPCRQDPCPIYRSNGFVNQVIELSGGRAEELNIQKGDKLNIVWLDSESSF